MNEDFFLLTIIFYGRFYSFDFKVGRNTIKLSSID